MDHYIDIKILPDPEFKETILMNALFAKLHRCLMPTAGGRVGVSFPRVAKTLGDTLRLHGTEKDLYQLMQAPWLKGLRDYTQISEVLAVPEGAAFCTVRRVQAKSAHNKRKRAVAKGWLTEKEAMEKIPDNQCKLLDLPFVQLTSQSNRNSMRVYIQHGKPSDKAAPGDFSSYGLSATSTVPWF